MHPSSFKQGVLPTKTPTICHAIPSYFSHSIQELKRTPEFKWFASLAQQLEAALPSSTNPIRGSVLSSLDVQRGWWFHIRDSYGNIAMFLALHQSDPCCRAKIYTEGSEESLGARVV
jgi:hypothetical protein